MKAKRGYLFKTFCIVASIMLALSFVLIYVLKFRDSGNSLQATFNTSGDVFTGVDENGLVFNIEKVGVIANEKILKDNGDGTKEDITSTRPFTTPLYDDVDGKGNYETLTNYMLSKYSEVQPDSGINYREYYPYYYQPIDNGMKKKYIVKNNEFVMLNNTAVTHTDASGKVVVDYYKNNSIKTTYLDNAGTEAEMQEAIMLSFGQRFYENFDGVADEDAIKVINGLFAGVDGVKRPMGAGINFVANVTIKCNGEKREVPMRAYDSTFADFAMIIEQKPENEGYWTIELSEYLYKGVHYSGSFGFYLIFNTSYTGTVVENGQVYNVAPNILCDGNPIAPDATGTKQYRVEENSSYPVITYDYTKYELSYDVVYNGEITSYKFENLDDNRALLRCTYSGAKNGSLPAYYMSNYDAGAEHNLVSVVLTDLGEYTIHYKYIYTGNNYLKAPKVNLTLADEKLKIAGVNLGYYNNLTPAQMKYVTFANNESLQHINLIVPNGYDKSGKVKRNELMYSFNTTSNLRVGSTDKSEGGNVNLANGTTANVNSLANLFLKYKNAKEATEITTNEFNEMGKLLKYVKDNNLYTLTNQGPIELKTNEDYNFNNSFYLYSKDALTLFNDEGEIVNDKLEELKSAFVSFDRQSNFDDVGYYLAFICTNDGEADHYTLFAFKFSSNTGNVKLFNEDDAENKNPLHSGGYTNKNVKVVWEERGVFERKVSVSYYTSYDRENFSGSANVISGLTAENGLYTYILKLDSGYLHYKIGINVEGLSTVYSYITIDKQPISGVAIYEVEDYINNLGVDDYRYVFDLDGRKVEISNAITNNIAGIEWNDKASGANITVKYTLTEFVPNGNNAGEIGTYHTTPYKLATSSSSSSGSDEIDSDNPINPLIKQGIYMFTFTDEAGNECDYAFIIDKTENYFKIINAKNSSDVVFASSGWLTYYNDVKIEAGSHKIIDLEIADIDEKVKALINKAIDNNVEELENYFVGAGSNYSALNNLFKRIEGKPYLVVANDRIEVRDNQERVDESLSKDSITNSDYTINMAYRDDGENNSMIRYFYLAGVNNRLDITNAGTSVMVEINTDNSRGLVYYDNSKDNLTQNIESDDEKLKQQRLFTGATLNGANATGDNFVAFTWLEGSGNTEVESVILNYYRLGSEFNNTAGSKTAGSYYNVSADSSITLYQKNTSLNSNVKKFINKSGLNAYVALINPQMGSSAEGLYIITRTYVNSEAESGADVRAVSGKDKAVRDYYFIIDRSEIIDIFNEIIGGGISLNLGESKFNKFNSFNIPEEEPKKYKDPNKTNEEEKKEEKEEVTLEYRNYLNNASATKLPAKLNVPISKYYKVDSNKIGNYYAGRLEIAMYFIDSQNQLSNVFDASGKKYNEQAYKLFEIVSGESEFENIDGKIYYTIDVTKNLSDEILKSCLVSTAGNTSWLTLPGDYVIVINDKIKGTTKHEKTIGLRIRGGAEYIPSTPVYATDKKEASVDSVYLEDIASYKDKSYYLTTNKEFVKINISKADANSTQAQVDPDFINIKAIRNGVESEYLNINNGYKSEPEGEKYSYSEGNLTVNLNTYLRDRDGDILTTSYEKQMTYLITVRYKTTNNYAYYYIDEFGNKQYYFEATYTVVIDRVPPKENIEALMGADKFSEQIKDIFETSYKDGGENGVIYATHYKDYYNGLSNKNANIYPLKVNANSVFNASDVKCVYVNRIDDIATQNLANVFNGEYVKYNKVNVDGDTTYGAIGIDNTGNTVGDAAGYYEIVEVDACGNITQYVVLFEQSERLDNITFDITYFGVNELGQNNTDKGFTSTLGEKNLSTITVRNFVGAKTKKPQPLYDVIYRIELKDLITGRPVGQIATNPTTDFDHLGDRIINLFKTASYGNYTLTISNRTDSKSYNINYHENRRLSASKLVNERTDGYVINLAGANEKADKNSSAYYYATLIELTKYIEETDNGHSVSIPDVNFGIDGTLTYVVGNTNNPSNPYQYYEGMVVGENPVANNLVDLRDLKGNFKIHIKDNNGNDDYYLFSTDPNDFFYGIEFGKDKLGKAYNVNRTYYAFDQVTVSYKSFYFPFAEISYNIEGTRKGPISTNRTTDEINALLGVDRLRTENGVEIGYIGISNGQIIIRPYFKNGVGGVITADIVIKDDNGNVGASYDIVIDTRFGSAASLVDDRGRATDMSFYENVADIKDAKPKISATGTRYLSWTNYESMFTFDYKLYEQKNDGEFNVVDLNEVTNYRIDPTLNSSGVFRFVIEAYSPTDELLGNVVYAFNVQAESNDLYSARVGDKYVSANSTITINEIISIDGLSDVGVDTIVDEWNKNDGDTTDVVNVKDISTTAPIPLYVFNDEISIERADDVDYYSWYKTNFAGNVFTIYRIGRGNDVRFVATLQVEHSANLVDLIKVNGLVYNKNNQTLVPNGTFAPNGEDEFVLTFNRWYGSTQQDDANLVLQKNVLLLDVYYYDQFVKTVEYADINGFDYSITGSGRFNFVFRDLAGNSAELYFSHNGEYESELIVTVLNEVAVSVNGQAPVPNGFYNGTVSVNVLNLGSYSAASPIEVYYSYNGGQRVKAESSNFNYTFTAAGWYKVDVNAEIDGEKITRNIQFTIINPNEAFNIFSLKNSYINITKVLNSYGADVTNAFVDLVLANNGAISYNLVAENASKLGVGFGKHTFTVSYECDDKVYPTRENSFIFTLNNEVPVIESSLKAGEHSNKGFNISFNAGEIYRQVGDCVLYVYRDKIGGRVAYSLTIDANTKQGVISKINFDRNGKAEDGDYYVVLMSSSGNYLNSFKVSITEPLNKWAIIVIVVVVVVVSAVVISIILLRRKMRIR